MESSSVSANVSSLGTQLRQARTGLGRSIDDVAKSLKLSPRIIGALEDDAYDTLPGSTYVRGYLRGYAQLLGLAPQPLIDLFNNLPQAAHRADMTAPAPVREVTSSDAMVRFGTLAVAVIVLGLAALWWSGKDGSSVRRRVTAMPAPIGAFDTPAGVAEVESGSAPAAPIKAPETASVAEEKAVAPVAAIVPAERAPSPADPDAPRVRLVLRALEDTWADVRDAQQRRLVYETIAAGRVVNVEGAPPLSIFLGNVDGVSVEFNGRSYDALRHKRGQIARFTLGSTGGN